MKSETGKGSAKGLVPALTALKINKDEANSLAALKFNNGEYKLTLEDRNFVYEMVWLLNQVGFEKTFNFLSTDWEKVLGSHNIRKRMLFENPLMEKTRDKFILDMDIFKNSVEVEAGEKCRKCGSEETISVVLQLRSADEASSIKHVCLGCGKKWASQ